MTSGTQFTPPIHRWADPECLIEFVLWAGRVLQLTAEPERLWLRRHKARAMPTVLGNWYYGTTILSSDSIEQSRVDQKSPAKSGVAKRNTARDMLGSVYIPKSRLRSSIDCDPESHVSLPQLWY